MKFSVQAKLEKSAHKVPQTVVNLYFTDDNFKTFKLSYF